MAAADYKELCRRLRIMTDEEIDEYYRRLGEHFRRCGEEGRPAMAFTYSRQVAHQLPLNRTLADVDERRRTSGRCARVSCANGSELQRTVTDGVPDRVGKLMLLPIELP